MKQDETMELSRLLHDVATQVFEMAMVEEPDFEAPKRTLAWSFEQDSHNADEITKDRPPTARLVVRLELIAQSSGTDDRDLCGRICNILGNERFMRDPLIGRAFEQELLKVGTDPQAV